ncbi:MULTISPECIES: hypothetical protein [unclassified Pseudomonas]|uniref:hypothetical protein n=1 Tax=unclassified Pseudomonas TaxID=196821 RepID=UPI000B7553E1|nr:MULTISPECIES: hypothetical protein [Pseudomonas]SNT22364.1 hypothetical protein SAMN05660216_03094 [Pseudomonas sp. LAMO17WK12:I8]SNY27479.1 hypothetical protein SAMN05660344_03020 [Pseudomonas sp. LAMO17WK12:I11]SNY27939.1 hypothetical protein SAMN05660700_03097 [Pseudomonas sp. LAMO17WK12:I7]SNY28168.1 hypothetical protein SAMN05660893_03135 [Pseudomonas sp. LAMO17WK12:I12]
MSTESQSPNYLGVMDIGTRTLNTLWHDRYPALSDAPGEMINLGRQTGPGTKKFKQLQMGLPKLAYRSSGATLFLDLEQRALREMEVTLTTDAGASAPWMSYVRRMELPGHRTLIISIAFAASDERFRIVYSTLAGRAVSLVWNGAVDYTYSGNDSEQRLLAEHYNEQKKVVLYHLLAAPENPWLQDVALVPAADLEGIVYDLVSPSTAELERGSDMLSTDLTWGSSHEFVAAVFATAFPEIPIPQRPLDSEWMASLMVPEGTALVDPSQDLPATVFFKVGYKRKRSAAMEDADIGVASDPLSVSPLMCIVGAGFEKELMEISDLKNATIVFVGDQHGALEKSDSACYYVPPPSQAPSVIYEDVRKTLEKPAQVETVRERAVFDVIKVTVNGNSALSTFVTLYARQTHYIKYSVVNGSLTLQLWYYDVDEGKDMPVPAGETEWSTLHGGGSVSNAGVFTPGNSAPSTVSVIAGRDLGSSRLLYWAVTVIPVPLYSATQAVKFFND